MPETSTQQHQTQQITEPTKIKSVSINLIRIFTNFFWRVVDTLSYKSERIAQFYIKSIRKEYLNEYQSLGLEKGKKILHIGCGPYPLTEISLAQHFNAQVVGIDNNQNIIKMAKEIVTRNNLDDQVRIEHGDGINYPVAEFDLIIISSCAIPKNMILENLLHNAKKDCIIIIRELDIAMSDITLTTNKHKNVEIIKQSHHHPIPIILLIPWTSMAIKIK
jgi:2-polyprenyl-3-methyl-5-hydroxy-6-metoxy-1,4-benzoquinol methylase